MVNFSIIAYELQSLGMLSLHSLSLLGKHNININITSASSREIKPSSWRNYRRAVVSGYLLLFEEMENLANKIKVHVFKVILQDVIEIMRQ